MPFVSLKDSKTEQNLKDAFAGVHRNAALPEFAGQTLERRASAETLEIDREAHAFGRKAALYATCYGNDNNPEIGVALLRVLARNGVETEIVCPDCCGMPRMERRDLKSVAAGAARNARLTRSNCSPRPTDTRHLRARTRIARHEC